MIRLFTGDNRLERERRRALATGELKDVTCEAREHGITDTVCISNRLWRGLISPYPFAEPKDCLSLSTLLRVLKQRLSEPRTTNTAMVVLLPPDVPEWFRAPCYIQFLFISRTKGPNSVIIRPHADHCRRGPKYLEDSLPATLLARLGETIAKLEFVSRPAEQGLLDSMRKFVNQLIETNPFFREIAAHVTETAPYTSLLFPADNYRSVLLADLDELLAILAECADLKTKLKIEALKSHYRALLSPLAAFRHILEDLLHFTAAVSADQITLQGKVFAQLLSIYADTHARLTQLQTEVPKDALAVVRFQICLLTQVAATHDVSFLTEIERACSSLLTNRWSHCTHGPTRECRNEVVWH